MDIYKIENLWWKKRSIEYVWMKLQAIQVRGEKTELSGINSGL